MNVYICMCVSVCMSVHVVSCATSVQLMYVCCACFVFKNMIVQHAQMSCI